MNRNYNIQRRLGISMRVTNSFEYYEPRDAVSHDWVKLLQEWNYLPVLLSNKIFDIATYISSLELDGIVLTGGNNLTPAYAGCPERDIPDASGVRDEFEWRLLNYVVEKRLPVFGVCRGLQVINGYFNGSLRDVDRKTHEANPHNIRIQGNFWKELLGEETVVNSYHNYGIAPDSLAPELLAFAIDHEGNIEGAIHSSLPILGIMWHPERAQPVPISNKTLLERLVTEGIFWEL